MASTAGLHEDILTCAVCREAFTTPCTLPCQHTFCLPCVTSHVQTGSDVDGIQGLVCPFCYNVTAVPDRFTSIEECLVDMKANPIIEKMLKANSESDVAKCSYCKEECDTTLPDDSALPNASAWCSDCEVHLCDRCLRVHNRIPSTNLHEITHLTRTHEDEYSNNACQEHEDELVQFYCPKCKKTLCYKCVTSHDVCDSVVTLESELLAVRKCLGARQERLVGEIKRAAMKLDDDRECLVETKSSLQVVEAEIRSAAAYGIEQIREKESRLLKEVTDIRDRQSSQLRQEIAAGEMAVLVHRQQLEIFSQTMAQDSVGDMCDLYEDVKDTPDDSPGYNDDDTSRGAVLSGTFSFSQNRIRFRTALQNIQLGEIVRTDRVLDIGAEPVLEDALDTRSRAPREKVPWINDVLELMVGGTEIIVATDFENKAVRSFYPGMSQQFERVLETSGAPFCLAKLNDNRLAVTIPETQEIIVVEVSDDIALKSTIMTSKQYWGITALPHSLLAAGSLSPPSVDLLDMDGNVIRSISPRVNDKDILHSPNYLCTTSSGNILVSNGTARSILCLTREGDVVFHYTPTDRLLVSPRGIAATASGDILVVDNYFHRVVRLTDTGKYVGHILTSRHGLKYPHGVYVNHRGRLIVSMYEKGILVFSLVKD